MNLYKQSVLYFLPLIVSNYFYPQTHDIHTITVFVHGTFPARKILQSIPLARELTYCRQGMSLAKHLPQSYHFHKMAQNCSILNSQRYNLDRFYVFGWESEHVYHTTRMQAAANLVKELEQLVNNYYVTYNIIPKVQLIGFSHGGNVVINTANYLPLKVNQKTIEVTVWLFGTPVQQINQNLINSQNFHKVYAIFSEKDWLQRMDPQGLRDKKYRKKYFWSDRTFEKNSSCVQASLTVNGQAISHSYFRCIFKYLPKIQQLIEQQSKNIHNGMIAIDLKL